MGRDRDAQLIVLSEQVSRRHAEIHREGSRLRLRDLGSRNATTVNGEPVRGWTDLADGDVIRFGDVEAVVELVGHDDRPDFATGPTRPTERTGVPASRVPVFVSHSSADKSTVRAPARFLQARGWQIWIDEAGIAAGKQWHGELIRALEATWVVLLVAMVGLVGFLAVFALFAYLGLSTVTTFATAQDVTRPFLGWGLCVVSIVVAGVGEALRRAGRRRGI